MIAQTFYANVEPESLLILASFLWIGAALATGVPTERFPSEFPLLFAAIGAIAALIGVTEFVPENIDILFTFIGVVLFTVTPIAVTYRLYQAYPPQQSDSHEMQSKSGRP